MAEYEWNFESWAGKTLRQTGSPDEWALSTLHRKQIMQMVSKAFPDDPSRRIAVWGAGKCNDIDLSELVKRFAEVHLVDIESDSLNIGLESQALNEEPKIILHGDTDLSGIARKLESKDAYDVKALTHTAADHRISGLNQMDLVLSTCVLSQIICAAVEKFDAATDKDLVGLVTTLRRRHIELMIDHLVPGGRAILVTDIVSSDSLPELSYAGHDELGKLLQKAIETQNFFHGLNPLALQRLFDEADIKEQLSFCSTANPWAWKTPDRVYAILAVAFEKKSQ